MSPSTVLVITKHLPKMEIILAKLEENGFRIIVSHDGARGLKLGITHKPDIIVFDMIIREDNDWHICQQLRQTKGTKDIPVLLLLSRTCREDLLKGIKLGVAEFMMSPFFIEEFLIRLNKLRNLNINNHMIQSLYKKNQLMEIRIRKILKEASFKVLAKILGNISHDISNMLYRIQGRNELAQLSCHIDDITRNLKLQEKDIELMASFTANLRDSMMDMEEKNDQIFDPLDVIHVTLRILEQQLSKQSIIINILEKNKQYIQMNKAQFFQVCLNLIVNAQNAMKDGGKLRIIIEKNNQDVLIHFIDNGYGIENKRLPELFELRYSKQINEPYCRTGLLTVSEIIKGSGGKIEVLSKRNKGTTFTICLSAVPISSLPI